MRPQSIIRHNMNVRLKVPTFSHVSNRTLKSGTPGVVLALRDLYNERQALVKFRGSSWPLTVNVEDIEQIK